MSERRPLGGVIHTYQKFDPVQFPSPTQPPPDMVSGAFEHLFHFGSTRRLTPEELARAVKIDPSQIKGLGPSLESLRAILEERKRKILSTYETETAEKLADKHYHDLAKELKPPAKLKDKFERATREEQLRDMEELWYQAGGEQSEFAKGLVKLVDRLGDKYHIEEMAARYEFTGREGMDVQQALLIKEELETIDRLLKQLEEAMKTAQIGVIDIEDLKEFAEPGDIEQLMGFQQQIQDYLKEMAERQGIDFDDRGTIQLTPKAYRLFQSKLLDSIFSELVASRSGRHMGPIVGEGAAEMQTTKPYEFGDSVAQMDIPGSMINALVRGGREQTASGTRVRLKPEDIEIHRTRNNPKCATVVLLDMSGSMRYDGQYINVKRMGLALDGLIRSEYPGDFLQFIEMCSFAKPRHTSEVAGLMPKPVTVYDPIVRLKADMADPEISEWQIPPHFTNIQHGLQLARKFLATQDTLNRQIIVITDGLPTAHFEGSELYLLYPPDPRTEEATLKEGLFCAREGIVLNMFLLPSWNQTSEDVQFAHKLAESTKGRVFFTAGRDLDRYVIWDYVKRRKTIVS